MFNNPKDIFLLIAIYISIVLVIVIRVYSDPAKYTTPDSKAYLSEAERILSNKTLSIFDYKEDHSIQNEAFTIWPIGYPLLIASISWVTHTPVLIASKLLNFIFLGLLLLLLYKWFGSVTWFPALYFFSYSMLEVFSHTWSDGPFLFSALLLCYTVSKSLKSETDPLLFLKLFACLVSLFLLRYAGVLYFFFIGSVLLLSLYRKDYKRSVHYLVALSLSTIFVALYFYNNQLLTGYYFGSHRAGIANEPVFGIVLEIIQGTVNELTMVRNYYFNGYVDYLYAFLTLFQGFVVYTMIKYRKLWSSPVLNKDSMKILLCSAVIYFGGIIFLRQFQVITEFNYRILSPATTLFYIALFISIAGENQNVYFRNVKPWIVGLMILSLLINLPKEYIFNKFSQFFV